MRNLDPLGVADDRNETQEREEKASPFAAQRQDALLSVCGRAGSQEEECQTAVSRRLLRPEPRYHNLLATIESQETLPEEMQASPRARSHFLRQSVEPIDHDDGEWAVRSLDRTYDLFLSPDGSLVWSNCATRSCEH